MNTTAIILKKEQQTAAAANITELVKTISDTRNNVTTTISHFSLTNLYRAELRFYRRLAGFITRHHIIAYMVAVAYVLTCLVLALIR